MPHNAYPPPPIPAIALAAINDFIEGAKPQNIVPEPEEKRWTIEIDISIIWTTEEG